MIGVLVRLGVTRADLSWTFVNTNRMTKLNQKYMGHEGSTDVITLQCSQIVRKKIVYGDAFICIDEAFANAKIYKTSPLSEIFRYMIHSVLHLQGYDDLEPEKRRVMKRHEDEWTAWAEECMSPDMLIDRGIL